MDDCIFCRIAVGASPASVVYEDEMVLAFMDILPINEGHLLVIPKKHATYLADMDEETGAALFRATMRVTEAVRQSGVRCEGVNLFVADGEAAGQEVFHVHMHIIPRYKGDKFIVDAVWPEPPPREALDETANRIQRTLLT